MKRRFSLHDTMPTGRKETNALWRSVRADARAMRSRSEARFTEELERLMAAGSLGGEHFGNGHWRLWNPARPSNTVDYWPRTGALVRGNRRLQAHGLRGALRTLAVVSPGSQRADDPALFIAAGRRILDLRAIEHGHRSSAQWHTIRTAMESGAITLVSDSVAEYFRDVLPPRSIFAAGFSFAEGNEPRTVFVRLGTCGAPWLMQRGNESHVVKTLRSLLGPVRERLA